MSISNSLAGLLTGDAKIPAKSTLGVTGGDQTDGTGEREIDAALAFAASLLDASRGKPLPDGGNILPTETATPGFTQQADRVRPPSSDGSLVTPAPPIVNMRGDARLTSWPPVVLEGADTTLPIPITTSVRANPTVPTTVVSDTTAGEILEEPVVLMPAAIDSLRLSSPPSSPATATQSEGEVSQVAVQSVVNALVSQSDARSNPRKVTQPTNDTSVSGLTNDVSTSDEIAAAARSDRFSTKVAPLQPGTERAALIAKASPDAATEYTARATSSSSKTGGRLASLGGLSRISLPSGDLRQGSVLPALASLSVGATTTLSGGEAVLMIDRPLSSPNWSIDFTQRVAWAVSARVPSAQISLNPEHLGPVELMIEVEDQQARIQFNATHGLTREAIEQSLPRLREALEQQGLSLEQASVGDFTRGHRDTDGQEAVANNAKLGDDTRNTDDADEVVTSAASTTQGLIDTFV